MRKLRGAIKNLVGVAPSSATELGDVYQACLTTLLSKCHKICVVVIGANDGKINDPFYSFALKFPTQTIVLLVEPQFSLHEVLGQNYAFHPQHLIAHSAIGNQSELTMFAVKPQFWSALQPDYAKGWPPYRAATGITSSDRHQVEKWVSRYGSNLSPSAVVEELTVRCSKLPDLLREHAMQPVIDVLQIDAEGADDYVLYACAIDETQPKLIFLETKLLPADRKLKLENFLKEAGYVLQSSGGDTLAIRPLAF